MDDFSFDNSVWSVDPPVPSTSKPAISNEVKADAFDDFDDFADPVTAVGVSGNDDDDGFGDFGDFGDGDANEGFAFEEAGGFGQEDVFADALSTPKPSASWEPIPVDPLPPPNVLSDQVNDLLEPLWAHIDLDSTFTQEQIRQTEGINQTLVTAERQVLPIRT